MDVSFLGSVTVVSPSDRLADLIDKFGAWRSCQCTQAAAFESIFDSGDIFLAPSMLSPPVANAGQGSRFNKITMVAVVQTVQKPIHALT